MIIALLVAVAASCVVPMADLGGPSAQAVDVNESGLVLGIAELPASTEASSDTVVASSLTDQRAFRWQPGTGTVELASGKDSFVWAVNDAGSMVGVVEERAVFFGVPPSA